MNQYEIKQLLQIIALNLGELNNDPKALQKNIEEANRLSDLEQAKAADARQMIEKNASILAEAKSYKEETQNLADTLAADRASFDKDVQQFLAEKSAFLQTKQSFEESFGKMQQTVDERARLNQTASQELENKKAEFAKKQEAFNEEKKVLDEKRNEITALYDNINLTAAKLAG